MKSTRFAILFVTITILVATTIPTYTQEPGQWRLDTVYSVYPYRDPNLPRGAVPGSDVRGWWWLPITNENLLISHINKENEVATLMPRQPLPRVHVFPGAGGGAVIPPVQSDTTGNAHGIPVPDVGSNFYPGIALIETTNYVAVVGCPGIDMAEWLMNYISTHIEKPIRWLIIPDVMESSWASARELYEAATPQNPLTVITSAAFADALSARQAVAPNEWMTSSTGVRRLRVAGGFPILPADFRVPRDTDWRVSPPSYDWFGTSPLPSAPNQPIPNVQFTFVTPPQLTLQFQDVEFRFARTLDEIGGLVTYIPSMKMLIPPGLFDGHLVNTAPLQWPVIPIRKVIAAVELMKTFDIKTSYPIASGQLQYYLPLRSLFMGPLPDGRSKGLLYLDATLAALNSIHEQTLAKINEGKSLDDIIAEVTIPDAVLSQCNQFWPVSPCGEFVNSLASVVKGIYVEYMGWFDGTARSLSAHVTATDKAGLLLEVAGGDIDRLVMVARKATAAAENLASIERALYLVEPIHELAPSREVDLMYFQLLWKAGMLQTANDVRNYYLYLAWSHRPQ